MKVKLIIISIILLLVMVFASGCIPFMEKIGLINPTDEEQLSPEKGGPPDGLIKVLIGFNEKPGPAQQAMVKGVGGQIKYTYHIVDAIAASIPQKAIDALQKNPNVRYVELDGTVYALDAELDNSWGVDRIDAEEVWTTYTGKGVNVAIIDSGIDNNHPDLNVEDGVNFVSKPSWKIPDPNKWDDDYGHGTHVAGIVAALNNGIGVVGVAPGAFLYALKVLDERGRGSYSDVIAALQWCEDNDIQVTNNSYGSSGDPGETVEAAFDNSASAGVLHVAAAGNGGSVIYPAAYYSVIAVSATNSADELAWFSSIGPEVKLAAPGVDIYSTYKDGGYATYSGTSMAAPHVAGTAALVWAANPLWTNGDVRIRLQDYAEDIYLPDIEQGKGLVDAENAVLDTTGGDDLPSTATGTISGTVTDIDTEEEPIEGGLVTANGYSTYTDAYGMYTLADLPVGDYTVTASADGYESDSKEVTVIENETFIADFSLNQLPANGTTMHVDSIVMSLKIAGINVNAIATVTIFDAIDNPVGGATVYGTWSGAAGDSDSGVTDTYGKVSLQSNKVKNPTSGVTTFTFTVDGVTKYGWEYDPDVNEETSGSIMVE